MADSDLPSLVYRFPNCPGVYIMRDGSGAILYVGKAARLRARVKSYFSDTHADRRQIPFMLRKVSDIDWIATGNETEALILEANLVRLHRPAYNVDLRDDKHYPYLEATVSEPFPRLLVVRRVAGNGSEYFGPYTDVGSMRQVTGFARKIFRIRDCNRKLPLSHQVRPCINYSMGRCSAPCAGQITPEEYRANVNMLVAFLRGKRKDVADRLREHMARASDALDFERAADLRDQIKLVIEVSRTQRVDLKTPDTNMDVFGVFDNGVRVCLCVLLFRQGLLLSKRHFLFSRPKWGADPTEREPVVIRFYERSLDDLPDEILLPWGFGVAAVLLESWFSTVREQKVRVLMPRRGLKAGLVNMAVNNARLYLAQKAPAEQTSIPATLKDALSLPRPVSTIEAFDVSNLGEHHAVAGMVHFRDGVPVKSQYRRFLIKTVAGQNDFAMMMEAVDRRLSQLAAQNGHLPDLLLIDGGKGQLNAAGKPLAKYRKPPMIISLAKKLETIHSPYRKQPVVLPENHPTRKLLQRIRDEVHRFAVTYHRSLRGRRFRASSLEKIPGIGPTRARALLKHFGSLKKLRSAAPEEIAALRGFSSTAAVQLLSALRAAE